MENNDDTPQLSNTLQTFDYHQKLRDHFKGRKKTWLWFKEENNKTKQIEELKAELLKNTYRIDKTSHQNLYDWADEACNSLSIDAEVTLYQEHNSLQLNAGISILEKEAHIVFSGNLIGLLSEEEFKALLAHELTHYLFYKMEEEEFEVTQRIALALANDPRSEDTIIETARIFQLYLELFCDDGALKVCQDYRPVVQMLVKIHTGLAEVNAESYISQAREIVKLDSDASLKTSHPESYIRCLALQLRFEGHADYLDKVRQLIEGELDLNKLDVFKQTAMQNLTQDLLQLIISPGWMNTSAILNMSQQYFSEFHKKSGHKSVTELASKLEKATTSVKNYVAYVLLDFAKADREMEGAPMGFTLELSEMLGVRDTYQKVIRKELKLTVREFKVLEEKMMAELQQVKEGKEESLYSD